MLTISSYAVARATTTARSRSAAAVVASRVYWARSLWATDSSASHRLLAASSSTPAIRASTRSSVSWSMRMLSSLLKSMLGPLNDEPTSGEPRSGLLLLSIVDAPGAAASCSGVADCATKGINVGLNAILFLWFLFDLTQNKALN